MSYFVEGARGTKNSIKTTGMPEHCKLKHGPMGVVSLYIGGLGFRV